MTGVTYVKEKPDLILMHDDNTIAVLDKEKDMPEPSAKVLRMPLLLDLIPFKLVHCSLFTTIRDRPHQTTSPKMVPLTAPVSALAQPKISWDRFVLIRKLLFIAAYQDSGLRMSRKYCHLMGLMYLQVHEKSIPMTVF